MAESWKCTIDTYELGCTLTMYDSDGSEVYQVFPPNIPDEYHEDHAALIVKAVNAHDDLVATLGNLMRDLYEWYIRSSNPPYARKLLARCRTLLASLEEVNNG